MKKFGFLLFLFVFMWAIPGYGHAASGGASIYLDGERISVPGGAKVEVVNGSTMVPIRVISENLNYDVNWNQQSRTVKISKDGTNIELVIGKKTATVNGQNKTLIASPLIRSDVTLVPLRFIAEQMGVDVSWDGNSKSVYLVTQNSGSGNGEVTPPAAGNNGTDGTEVVPEDTNEGLALVNGISFNDNKLIISTTNGTVKPSTFTMAGPDRIVIDLPHTAFAANFGSMQSLNEQLSGQLDVWSNEKVSQIRYALFSENPSTIRVVMDLTESMSYRAYNEGSNLIVVDLGSTNPNTGSSMPIGPNGKPVVVIDAGHGDQDPGAMSKNKKREKDFNLTMALKVEQALSKYQDIEVVLTRSNDTFLALKERVQIAENMNAAAFVSIHANSSSSATASGTETYYQRSDSKEFANVMHKHFAAATGLPDRGIRYGNFHVIRETSMPAVLLEAGYLSNAKDEAALFSTAFQDRVAKSIADAIAEYLGLN